MNVWPSTLAPPRLLRAACARDSGSCFFVGWNGEEKLRVCGEVWVGILVSDERSLIRRCAGVRKCNWGSVMFSYEAGRCREVSVGVEFFFLRGFWDFSCCL